MNTSENCDRLRGFPWLNPSQINGKGHRIRYSQRLYWLYRKAYLNHLIERTKILYLYICEDCA